MKGKFFYVIILTVIWALFVSTSAFASPIEGETPKYFNPYRNEWYSGFPVLDIVDVDTDNKVVIKVHNLPLYDRFQVLMGPIGTKGIDGYFAGEFDSDSDGCIICTFPIPRPLYGSRQISIRIESVTGSGYYAYNWFNNAYSGVGHPGAKPPKPGYSGYPTFFITDVVKDYSVTIKTHNLPPDDQFDVLMGQIGTKGKRGIVLDTINSGKGGKQTFTFLIPFQLTDQQKIAIRLQNTTGSGYFAYNWFYNNTTY